MATPNDRGGRGGKRGAPGKSGSARADARRPSADRPSRGAASPTSKGRPASKPASKPAPKSNAAPRARGAEATPTPVASSGPTVRVSRILDAPASAVFRALNDPTRRGWSPEPLYRVVSALAPRFVRLALPDGSQVSIGITRQGNVRCSVAVEQSGLPSQISVNAARDRWMGALAALAEQLDAEWD